MVAVGGAGSVLLRFRCSEVDLGRANPRLDSLQSAPSLHLAGCHNQFFSCFLLPAHLARSQNGTNSRERLGMRMRTGLAVGLPIMSWAISGRVFAPNNAIPSKGIGCSEGIHAGTHAVGRPRPAGNLHQQGRERDSARTADAVRRTQDRRRHGRGTGADRQAAQRGGGRSGRGHRRRGDRRRTRALV